MVPDPKPRFSSALSTEPDSPLAEEQVTARLLEDLAGTRPDLLCVFVSHHHGSALEELGPRLKAVTGAPVVLGCTGENIIGGDREIEQEPALSVWAASLPGCELRPFTTTAQLEGPGAPAFDGMPDVRDPARASILLLADPFSFPMDPYLKRLNRDLPGVPVVGGMASGGMGPGQNLLITDEGLRPGGAVGVVLEGGVEVRSVVSQGCRPVGESWVVTDSKEHLIRKLGGRPALDVLVETLQSLEDGDQKLFQEQPFLGIAIDASKSKFERGDFLVRGLMGLHAKDRAIAVADLPRKGQTVQFLVRDAASASEDLALLMQEQGGGALGPGAEPHSAGALLFSCNGRGTNMFDTPDHDISAVRAGLDANVPVAGFFAMGEIGPVGQRNFLHGFTASVAVFRPRD